MKIEKAYFTLPEVLDRWAISEPDLVYLAENDKLRLSVPVSNVKIFVGEFTDRDEGLCCAKSLKAGLPLSPGGLIPRVL